MNADDLQARCRRYAVVAALLTAGGLARADAGVEPGWRCAAPTATAYRRDDGRPDDRERWNTLVFPVDDQRFLIRPAAPGRWELVHDVGAQAVYSCTGDFDAAGLLRCGDEDQFEMNRKTLAFASHLFRADATRIGELTAATVTGVCQPL